MTVYIHADNHPWRKAIVGKHVFKTPKQARKLKKKFWNGKSNLAVSENNANTDETIK